MLIIIFGVFVTAVLVACNTGGPASFAPAPFSVANPPESAAGKDIYAQQAEREAQALRDAANIAMAEGTAEARQQANAIAAATAEVRAQEHARTVALTAAADAILLKQESDAATAQVLELTAESERQVKATGTAEAIAADAYNLELTRAAMELERRQDRYLRDQRRADFFNNFIPIVFILATLLLIVFGTLWFLDRRHKPSFVSTPSHAWMILPVSEPGLRGLVSSTHQAQPLLPAGDIIDGELSVNGDSVSDTLGRIPRMVNGREAEPIVVEEDRNPERTNRVLVHKLLTASRDYADITDGPRDVIPGYRNLNGFNSEMWMRATDILVRNQVIKKESRRATKFLDGWDIDTTLMEGNLNRLNYSPTPTA
jgi:hypothetical protein